MPSPRPPSWKRAFNPARDLPPAPGRVPNHSATAEQLSRWKLPKAPLGEFVFTQTREISLPSPLRGYRGRRNGNWLYYTRGDKQFVRAYAVPADPKTSYQVQQRMRMKQAHIGWWELTREQNEAWDAFAATIPHLAEDKGTGPLGVGFRANRLYISAQLNRLATGLPVRNDAPTRKCTQQIHDVELIAAPAPGQLVFRLFHGGSDAQGLRMLVEMTRAMPSDRRKPRENELTRAGMTDAGSFFPLGENGAAYLLDQPRHAVAPGQRFGLRVTLVTEEGLRSRSLFFRELRWHENTEAVAIENGSVGSDENYVSDIPKTSHVSHTSPASHQVVASPQTENPASFIARGAPAIPNSEFRIPDCGEAATLPSHEEINRRHRLLSDQMKAPPEISTAFLAEEPLRQAQYEAFVQELKQQSLELKKQRAAQWQEYKLQWRLEQLKSQ